ncbi:serine carboxypeptidase 1-like [Punica granatum]|uniref:Carboxypeptidase n=1 Tax=Punica granatum TaxID=22663 RepID=A0A6P8CFV1_PUNGR|nr:serine carboxypeptidase 1-like [Punica granatum]
MKLLSLACCIAFSLVLCVTAVRAAPAGSLITNLPGFEGRLPSQHHAGYVSINGKPTGKKNLFYYFVASQRNPSKDPVVLWLNGGPGCSSFDGFVYEHGPFNFQARQSKESLPKLQLNPYSWSKVSNMLYLDSPCGVGLSYSDNPKNYATGDFQTAADTHTFLLEWFELYPEFLSNPFYISGESYAGVYVPTLASTVAKGIKDGQEPVINFKGYLVGNGVADDFYDGNALVPFAFGMGLISSNIFEDCQKTCKGNYGNPTSKSCSENLNKVYEALSGLNPYDILEPCYQYTSAVKENKSESMSSSFMTQKRFTRISGRRWFVRALGRDGRVPLTSQAEATVHVPCINDDVATAWLNDESVRKAIHAAPTSVAGPWMICSDRVDYSGDVDSLIPYHKNLTSQGYRALIYSGDHDRVIPFTGTQAWTRSLGYKIVEQWRSWLSNKQVAGYLQAYDKNLTFLTIKGAGHMVPQYKPMEALDFYSRWLDGKPI